MSLKTGRCLCGDVGFVYDAEELWRGHCHCESCRRQTASPFTTFMGVHNARWQWTKSAPKEIVSSEGVRRYFCAQCGSPVAYQNDKYPDETHFYAALLDDHHDFQADRHFHWHERVAWVRLDDDLPRD